jgi:hypothetical protein
VSLLADPARLDRRGQRLEIGVLWSPNKLSSG